MQILKSATVVVAAVLATSAFGAAGTFTIADAPVTALSPNVTYRSATLQTFVGLQVGDTATGVLFANTGNNTINDANVTVSAKVTDGAETMTLYKPEVYLPSSCTWAKDGSGNPVPANTVSFTCKVAHVPSGATFPAFFVFYTAPTKAVNGSFDDLNSDFVSTHVQIVYAEGLNDQPGSVPQNSVVDRPQANLVLLGTTNPTNVKSGVSKDGVSLATGNNGIPTAATYPFASSLTVPPLPPSSAPTRAEILLSPDDDPQLCQNAGNFRHCYQAAVTVQNVSFVDTSGVMTLLLRIDGAEVINPFRPANIHIYHDGAEVFACQAGQPNAVTTACVQSISRYSNAASNGDLRQDAEARVLTLKNGSWGMR